MEFSPQEFEFLKNLAGIHIADAMNAQKNDEIDAARKAVSDRYKAELDTLDREDFDGRSAVLERMSAEMDEVEANLRNQ